MEMKSEVPKLTREDRAAALSKAIEDRRTRAEVKKRVHNGELSLSDVLEMRADPAIGRMKVYDLISSFKSVGEVKSVQIMQQCEISQNRRIAGLGCRQEARLREALSRYSL